MREQHVGALVIVEPRPEGTLVAGIVTDRDLAIEVLARGGDVAQVPVGRLAGGALGVVPQATSAAAMTVMPNQRAARAVVLCSGFMRGARWGVGRVNGRGGRSCPV